MSALQGTVPLLNIDGLILDPYTVTTPLTVRSGRQSPHEQPEANTVSFGVLGELPAQLKLGAQCKLSLFITGLWGGYGTVPDPGGDIWTDLWSPLESNVPGLLPPPGAASLWQVVSGAGVTMAALGESYVITAASTHDATAFIAPTTGFEVGDVEKTFTLTFRFHSASRVGFSVALGLWADEVNTTPGPADGSIGEGAVKAIPLGPETWVQATITVPATMLFVRPYLKVTPGAGAGQLSFGPYSATEELEGEEAEELVRFTGSITDIEPHASNGGLVSQVVATGRKADLGRAIVGSTLWAAETEAERVNRLRAELEPKGFDLVGDGASWYHAQRVQKRAKALDLLHELAVSGALVIETAEGVIVWEPWDSRAAADVSVSLSAGDILDGVQWSQHVGNLIKRAVVNYGAVASGGTGGPEASTVEVGAQGLGNPEAQVTTTLRDLTDATNLGSLILDRWSDPKQWEAPTIVVAASLADSETWDAIMGLSVSQVLETEGLTDAPTILPYGSTKWFVEGWEESWDRNGDGPIWQELAYAVSSFERFRPDKGADTVVSNIKVTPQSAKFGVDRTVTADVVTVGGATVTGGDAILRTKSGTEIGSATVEADGDLTFTIDGGDFGPGDYTLWIDYLGVFGSFRQSTAQVPTITVTQPDTGPGEVVAMTSLSVTPSKVKTGANVNLEAHAQLSDGTKQPSGRFTFQVSRQGSGGPWNDYERKDVGDGQAVSKWEATRPNDPAHFRAIFDPDRSGVSNDASSVKAVNVLGKESKTKTYNQDWGATYRGNGSKRTDTSDLYQGYVSGTNGDQRSLSGFTIPNSDWNGYTITKVEVQLKFMDWWKSSGGTALIGSHNYASEPGGNPNISARRTKKGGWKKGEKKWVDITGWGKGLATGSMKGICLGPAGNQSTEYYGNAQGTGADRPAIRITGYRWQ